MEPQNLPAEKDREFQGGLVKVKGIFLKDGSYIDLNDMNPQVVLNGKAKEIQYNSYGNNRIVVPVDNITSVKVDIVKGNFYTPLLVIGGICIVAMISLFILLSTGHFNITG